MEAVADSPTSIRWWLICLKALGLIEVRGKLGAILAADAAVKAANVTLFGSEVILGGLTTIHIIGDVAAVKAAVEAGEVCCGK